MATLRTRAFAAVLAALGLASLGTMAFAEQKVAGNGWGNGKQLEFRQGRDGNGRFQLAELGCGPLAADRMQLGLDGLAQRLKLTADQQKLFDTFRTTALTAQTQFAEQCPTDRPGDRAELGRPGMPAGPDGENEAGSGKTINPQDLAQGQGQDQAGDRPGRPDGELRGAPRFNLIEGLEQRLALDEARVTALKTILPDLKAFYASLTPDQIKLLGPGFGHGWERGFGSGRDGDDGRPAHRG